MRSSPDAFARDGARRVFEPVQIGRSALAQPPRIGQYLSVVTISYSSVIDLLRERIPEFGPSIDEEIEIDEGDVLPHLIFASLTRFVRKARQDKDTALTARLEARRPWVQRVG